MVTTPFLTKSWNSSAALMPSANTESIWFNYSFRKGQAHDIDVTALYDTHAQPVISLAAGVVSGHGDGGASKKRQRHGLTY
jgi:hypothetical protein